MSFFCFRLIDIWIRTLFCWWNNRTGLEGRMWVCTSRETAFRVLAVRADLPLAQPCGFVFYTILYLYLYPNSHPASLPQSLSVLSLKKIVLSQFSKLECGEGALNAWYLKSHILGKNWATQWQHLHTLQVWRPQSSYKNKFDKFFHQVVSLFDNFLQLGDNLVPAWWQLGDYLDTLWKICDNFVTTLVNLVINYKK